jgi:hypothetical protein
MWRVWLDMWTRSELHQREFGLAALPNSVPAITARIEQVVARFQPSLGLLATSAPVTVTGVAFFDRFHHKVSPRT